MRKFTDVNIQGNIRQFSEIFTFVFHKDGKYYQENICSLIFFSEQSKQFCIICTVKASMRQGNEILN